MPSRPYGGGFNKNLSQTPRYNARYPVYPEIIAASAIDGGINLTTDAADLKDNEVQDAQNYRFRYDKARRRPGTIDYGGTKPDGNKILTVTTFKGNDGVSSVLRFTSSTITRDAGTWTTIAGTITGSDADRFNVATAFNSPVFTNNGVDPIQQIDMVGNTFAQLGNAPRYRYCTVFANRVIGFSNVDTTNPIEVGWSGDANIAEWDPTVDISAGSGSLIQSPGDLSDFITGGFGFTNFIVILRERSLWLGTIQPIDTNPFNFYCDVPGIGCNCPYSVAVVPGGLIFADTRSRKIYGYTPGQTPQVISTPIEQELFSELGDPNGVYASYDAANNEYSLAIPSAITSNVKVWVFNLRTQAWSYDIRSGMTSLNDIEAEANFLTIDALTGNIDSLSGTIGDQTNSSTSPVSRIYGFSDGSLQAESEGSDTDAGIAFPDVLVTKCFTVEAIDEYFTRFNYEVYARVAALNITLSYSKDNGITWITARIDNITNLGVPRLIQYNKQIRSRKLTLKIESSSGDRDLLAYEVHAFRSAYSRGNNS